MRDGKQIEVLFCLRRDAPEKPGGDSGKVYKYKHFLERKGFLVTVVTDPAELNVGKFSPDIVHLFNMQTPYENYRYMEWALRKNVPLCFSPIHHEKKYMVKYFEGGLLGKLLNYDAYLMLSSFVKEFARFKTLSNLKSYKSTPLKINRALVEKSARIFPLSKSELHHIKTDVCSKLAVSKVKVLPNALTFIEGNVDENVPRDIDVMVVGRIEPRKNILKIAEALKGTNYRVVFAGKENTNHKKYCQDFKEIVGAHSNLQYLGELNQDQLSYHYKRSKINLSNSWFEVVSQVDLEATSLGCKPIVSAASALFDYFSSPPLKLEPDCSKAEILNCIEYALKEEYRPSIKKAFTLDWEDVTDILANEYTALLSREAVHT
ncbi:glycosyltransferase involved in cell wall biosynthesis [Pseudomonas sp. WPR_5_2]|uniref:glycosyltransferase n=1 Tax=Pseudomonas sp. WPR_5_2 TaxID=1907371 RepID=UPI000EAF00DA|nr:glycosyltransferase [Pseudomonas sp. WPR_5_2]RKS28655.1 glycosyltransferase involved in cell wall biosynthesis [Pseudomonas sp. WPR_5_2]